MEMFKFQHDAVKIYDAFGMSEQFDNKCKEIVHFSTISNHFMAGELFDDKADAPRSLTTLTGDLEKALSLCQSDKEKQYVLFNFNTYHDMACDTLAKYEMINELKGIEREKVDAMMRLIEIKLKEKAKEDSLNLVSPTELLNKVELVKQSKYNFEKYLGLVNSDELLQSISDKW